MQNVNDTVSSRDGQGEGQLTKGPGDITFTSRSLAQVAKFEQLNNRFPSLVRHYVRHSVRLAARSSLQQARAGAELDGHVYEAQYISPSPKELGKTEWLNRQRVLIGCGEVVAVRNMLRGLAEAQPSLEAKGNANWKTPELSTQYLHSLYALVTAFLDDNEFLDNGKVKKLEELVEKIQWEMASGNSHPAVLAAWVYWLLHKEHYFPMANSTMARLASRLVLQIAGYGFTAYIAIEQRMLENRHTCVQCLRAIDPSSFVNFYLEELCKCSKALEGELHKSWIDGPPPPAVVRLLDLLAIFGRLTTNQAAAELSLPRRTVRRYLAQLFVSGWLQREGKRGRYAYTLSNPKKPTKEGKGEPGIVVGSYTVLPTGWPHCEPRWRPSSPWAWPLSAQPFQLLPVKPGHLAASTKGNYSRAGP